jgi:uncharacterized glyoxalase superfamily protein PhnB
MLDWLSRVFGFEERARHVDLHERVRHAELYAGRGEIWINGHEPGFSARSELKPDAGLVVLVDDVDSHHARVTAAGGGCSTQRRELGRAHVPRPGSGGD